MLMQIGRKTASKNPCINTAVILYGGIFEMSTQRCSDVFVFVLQEEGGAEYTDDPRDPGGATKYGITLAVLRQYRHVPTLTAADVAALGYDEALAIFHDYYWLPVHGDSLPLGVDASVVDAAYNTGVSRAVKFLQQAVGVTVDGSFGQHTLAAVQAADAATVVNAFGTICTAFYVGLHNPTYIHGWLNRVNARVQFSLNSIQNSGSTVA